MCFSYYCRVIEEDLGAVEVFEAGGLAATWGPAFARVRDSTDSLGTDTSIFSCFLGAEVYEGGTSFIGVLWSN